MEINEISIFLCDGWFCCSSLYNFFFILCQYISCVYFVILFFCFFSFSEKKMLLLLDYFMCMLIAWSLLFCFHSLVLRENKLQLHGTAHTRLLDQKDNKYKKMHQINKYFSKKSFLSQNCSMVEMSQRKLLISSANACALGYCFNFKWK